MRKAILSFVLLALFAGLAHAQWNSFVIRNAPEIVPHTNSMEFIIDASGEKAGWGVNLPAGTTIGDLATIYIERLDDTARFTAGTGPAVAPYFNIWVTDGLGNYAVIANEPSNAEWVNGQQWNMTWDILQSKVAKAYENPAATAEGGWIDVLDVNGDKKLTFAEVASLEIAAPDVQTVSDNWASSTAGAPREFGTNIAYDFNWVFGDTLSNYESGDDGFIVANPSVTVVPEPATWTMLVFGVLSLLGISRLRRS